MANDSPLSNNCRSTLSRSLQFSPLASIGSHGVWERATLSSRRVLKARFLGPAWLRKGAIGAALVVSWATSHDLLTDAAHGQELRSASGQELILIHESSWFDAVIWQSRTDGSQSMVVDRVLQGGSLPAPDLKRGDRVVSYAGVFPQSTDELRELAEQMGDRSATLTVLRGDRIISLPTGPETPAVDANGELVEEIPQGRPELAIPSAPISLGEDARLLTPPSPVVERTYATAAQSYGFGITNFRQERFPGFDSPVLSGVLVEQVTQGSLANRSGISAGMIIVAVDGRRVDTVEEVERWLLDRAQQDSITFLAYEGRTLRRVRMSLDQSIESIEAQPSEANASPSNLLGGLLPFVGPNSPRENQAAPSEQSQRIPSGIVLPEQEPLESLPLPEPDPQVMSNATPPQDDTEASNQEANESSSRRGILGGLLRRDNNGEGRQQPLEQRARAVAIESLQRRIERQQRLLEEQQRELAALQAELKRLTTEDPPQSQ